MSIGEFKISEKSKKGQKISDIYIGLTLLLVIGGIALEYENWIIHGIIAVISLLFVIHILSTGAMLRGRIKRSSGNVFKIHKRSGIYFGSIILGSFVYGLWIKLQQDESILSSIHGKIGVLILLIVIFQIIPSLFLKKRGKYRGFHKVFGYSLAPVLVIDAVWGLHNGVVAGTKSLVLLHSLSGGIAALILIWIIQDMLHPTDRSLERTRIGSYLATFLITTGCWLLGGYNYLTSYGSQVKPVILAGPNPWAHEVIMETKEYIFVFLPIITIGLSFTLSSLDKDAFLNDTNIRRALTMITFLALFIVLLMFFMGAITSNTGNTWTEV